MTHNSSVNFKLTHFLLWIKGSHQIFNSENSECSGKNLPNHKSVFLQILHHFSVSWNITPLYFFSSDILHFVQKEPINMHTFETFECSGQNSSNNLCQFWNNSSIPKLQVSFSSNFASLFSVMKELILSKSYKVSAKKVQRSYLSCHWRVIHSLKKNGLAVFEESDEFSPNPSKAWKFLVNGLFLSMVHNIWPTKILRIYLL